MNLSEFKAWFEGFTESMEGTPSAKAWKRIQDRVKSIKSDEPTPRHVFHEYYERPWRRWYDYGPHWGSFGAAYQSQGIGVAGIQSALANQPGNNVQCSLSAPFDPQEAFSKLGRAEALSLSNVKALR